MSDLGKVKPKFEPDPKPETANPTEKPYVLFWTVHYIGSVATGSQEFSSEHRANFAADHIFVKFTETFTKVTTLVVPK